MSVSLHELIHILHYRITQGKLPKVKFTWWFGFRTQIKGNVTIKNKLINCSLAIIIGLIPLLIVNIVFLYLIYFFSVIMDLIIILALIILGKRNGYNEMISYCR